MSLVKQKFVFEVCEQRRFRSACASTQSDRDIVTVRLLTHYVTYWVWRTLPTEYKDLGARDWEDAQGYLNLRISRMLVDIH